MLLIQTTIFLAVAIPVFAGIQVAFEAHAKRVRVALFMARLESVK